MRTLTIASKHGGLLDLLNNPYFDLVEFDAETEAGADLTSVSIGGFDGDIVTNTQAQPRTASIELRIKSAVDVEEAKRNICQVIAPKQECTFHLERDGRSIDLTGYCESLAMPRYNNHVSMICSFHCSQPFWEDAVEVINTLSGIENKHWFTYDGDMLSFPEAGIPLSVYNLDRAKTYMNTGDVAVGMEIRITAVKTVTNPILYASNGNYIGVNTILATNDVVSITTHKGNKQITQNGVNILDRIKDGSTWLQLETGNNTFSIDADEHALDNVYFELIYKQRYV